MSLTLPPPAETLLRHAATPLPRYTSYPTAPHFTSLTGEDYAGWLRRAGPQDTLSLYVHVPFCHALCWYCGCHTSVTRSSARIERYARGLAREVEMVAALLPVHGGAASLHLGGGTPTALGAPGLIRLAEMLRGAFAFRPGAEVAAELDPRTLGADLLEALAAIGLTRASLGVQDITPAVQERIGRVQPAAQVEAAVRGLRAHGVAGINMDLIYGLPMQGVAEIEASARFAADCGADRVAVFGYAHVPWMKALKWIKVRQGQEVRLIASDDVCYFKAEDKYTVVRTRESESLIKKSIRQLTEELDPEQFWRIHRGTVINVGKIAKVHRGFGGKLLIQLKDLSETLTVSRSYAHLFKQM